MRILQDGAVMAQAGPVDLSRAVIKVDGVGHAVMDDHEKILLVDDDLHLLGEMGEALRRYGYVVSTAEDWSSAMAELSRTEPDLVVLDQNLGPVNSLARLDEVRARTTSPIVVLTGNDCEVDRVVSLETGAADFLMKPMTPRELVARVRAHLRREQRVSSTRPQWRFARRERRVYTPEGKAVPLTGLEFSLLDCLAEANGDPLSRNELSQRVLRRPYRVDDRSIDNTLYQIRRKVREAGGGDPIVSLRGQGFAFAGFDMDR
jgi:two-component system OmpR family response regulator